MSTIYNIKDVKPGMMVTQVIEQHGTVKVRKIGMIRSLDMVKGLSEMGVVKVIVDLEQSVLSDDAPLTPTQKLLDVERSTSKSARKTSHNFSKSMFVPSAQQLPTMWHLIGKPVSLACLFMVGGLSLGWSISKIPSFFQQETQSPSLTYEFLPIDAVQEQAEPEIEPEPKPEQEPEEQPIVLGYQPERIDESQKETTQAQVSNEAQESSEASQISPELMARFNAALAELDAENQDTVSANPTPDTYDDVPRVDQLPVALLTELPSMSFSAHLYSSTPDSRWVRVNGLRMVEGDFIAEDLQLINIEAQRVILSFKGEVFSMNALSDW